MLQEMSPAPMTAGFAHCKEAHVNDLAIAKMS